MAQLQPLSEILNQLTSNGYSLADAVLASLPDDNLLSNDWRLDSIQRVTQGIGMGSAALVIAVSSVERCLKLVFVEVLSPPFSFSPITLLRRLFPMRKRAEGIALSHVSRHAKRAKGS